MDSDTKIIVGGIVVFVMFLVGIGMLCNYMSELQCKNNVTEMGRNYRYDFNNGCRIQTKYGNYVYWKMYREVNN